MDARMKKWSYGINSYYKTASIYLEEAPWYLMLLQDTTERICDLMSYWNIPLIGRIKITKDSEIYTISEYYGGMKDLFHCFVDTPISNFCWKRTKTKIISIEWEKAKELFYEEDKEFWDKEIKSEENEEVEDV